MFSSFGRESVAVEEIIEVLPGLHQNICDQIDLLVNNHKQPVEVETKSLISFDWNAGNLNNIEDLKESNLKNSELLQKMQEKITCLEDEKRNTEQQITGYEKKLKSFASKKSKLNDALASSLEKRNCIQVCKLLTNTDFVYRDSGTSGYSFCPETKQIKSFEFNAKQSQKEITAALYDIIKTVSASSNSELETNTEVNES